MPRRVPKQQSGIAFCVHGDAGVYYQMPNSWIEIWRGGADNIRDENGWAEIPCTDLQYGDVVLMLNGEPAVVTWVEKSRIGVQAGPSWEPNKKSGRAG